MKPLSYLWMCLGTILFLNVGALAQENLTGIYSMEAGDASLTLKLNQQGSSVTGTLNSNSGANFQLSGLVENGIGYGTCSGTEGTVYFEAYLDGVDLTLGLVDMDEFQAPDYNSAQYLQFTKSTGGGTGQSSGSISGVLGLGGTNQQGNQQQNQQQTYQQQNQQQNTPGGGQAARPPTGSQQNQPNFRNQNATVGTTGNSNIGQGEIGDPSWGFKFRPPQGWVHQVSAQGVLLGHNTIAGMILVLPHMFENMQQLQAEMQSGVQEQGSTLTLTGGLQNIGQNVLGGDYTGVMDGTQVKARGFGTLSPYGGSGATIVALSTPEGFSQDLLAASESVYKNMQYFKVDVSDLVQHFAGNWSNFTSNTSTWICFCPDGTYSEEYESSYSGNFNDGSGTNTGSWNTAGQDSDRGRWTVRGNKDSGTIIVRLANGNEITYEYRVHEERGEKYYREYHFNGYLYSKK